MLKGEYFPVLSPTGRLMKARVDKFSKHGKIYFGNNIADKRYSITNSEHVLYSDDDNIYVNDSYYELGIKVVKNAFWEGFNYEDF